MRSGAQTGTGKAGGRVRRRKGKKGSVVVADMKLYYKMYRRKPNMIFFLVLGGIFLALGVLGIFWLDMPGIAIGCMVFGAVLAVVPQFVIFSRYGLRGEWLRFRKWGIPKKIELEKIGGVVLCIYDEYRRNKGYVPATFSVNGGQAYIPAIVLLRSVDEGELDLCDTRSATLITFRKERITDAVLEFAFLEELYKSAFAGKIYVSESIATLYKPALDEIFGNDDRVVVYDRLPKGFPFTKK